MRLATRIPAGIIASRGTGKWKPGDQIAGFLDLGRCHLAAEHSASGVASD